MISLKDGDEVIGAVELTSEQSDLVFITDDAQLLRFGADKVRPQGRAAGGMAGVTLTAGSRAVSFTVVNLTSPDGEWAASVVTVAGSRSALPGTEPGTAKVTPFAEFPAKGRATSGVRCHRFLKGEDVVLLAWVGLSPARAMSAGGAPVPLPESNPRRDGSGTPLPQPIAAIGGSVAQG
jgi:DNA gyrase subunit A